MGSAAAPTSDLELYRDKALLDPHPRHETLEPRVEQLERGAVVPKPNNVLHGLGTCAPSVA